MGNSPTDCLRMNGVNPSVKRIEDDFYSTEPKAVDYLLSYEEFTPTVWECACGNGNLTYKLEEYGYNVVSSDIVNRGLDNTLIYDFLTLEESIVMGADIITNPPYSLVTEFVEKGYELCYQKMAMFLKIQFLESIKRYDRIFKRIPPKVVYIFVKRMPCYRNDDRSKKQSAVCYCWVVWDKNYNGDTILRWIPNHEF